MTTTTLRLDVLEARDAPVIAIEYLFLTYAPHVSRPSPAFAGVKVELPTVPLGQLVGWPPITVKR